ncbi:MULTISPECIES: hypothetical protein [Xanthomonas]|uniref:hypothetical protein n=1 Tax=Xanthomonas TaxID=338 RepID=UPI001AF26628|nr:MULTISPECIES: hypothetical protein [Xanthomonas]MCC8444340.1 hypothetical protein [Xanthomonas cannabis]CAD7375024.1 hypothetical protein X12_000243 [Xanthomonas arboricola]CAG2082796.1 hypothetical protein XCY_000242 [Xanthomonas arboricola pv. juglandis]
MIFEIENCPRIENPDEFKIRSSIKLLKSYGPRSFAILENESGDYLQVAGGGVTCMLEKRDGMAGKQYRGYKHEKSRVFPDGTVLAFGGGELVMQSDEWFSSEEIAEVFCCFLKGEAFPDYVMWREGAN